MRIAQLRVHGIRNLQQVAIEPGPVNWIYGDNGAGKTSILEALHLTAFGRSFRGGGRWDWLARGTDTADVFCRTDAHRIGWAQTGKQFRARLDGVDVATRAQLSVALPCLTFHPQSHELIQGTPDNRRSLLDYAVFHVEPSFLEHWKGYRRAQGQRNAALRARAQDRELEPWESAMAAHAQAITMFRQRVAAALMPALADDHWVRYDGQLFMELATGWPEDESFARWLLLKRARDRELGHTRDGPHRCDLRLKDQHGLVAGRLSRGQQKMLALRLLVAVGEILQQTSGVAPVFCLDDMTSELDDAHQQQVQQALMERGWQLWLTGVERPTWPLPTGTRMFHVEHGVVGEGH